MSLQAIHCEHCNGTGRVWKDDIYNVVCLGCEGTGLIRLTPEQSAQRQRDAEARRLQQAELMERYRIEYNKRRERNKVLLIISIVIAVPLLLLFVSWFSQLSGIQMCGVGVLIFIVIVIVAKIFEY